MNFCSNCGTRVVLKVPEGDFLPRHVCENCGTIHYQNPKLVVGRVPEYEGRILICKRGIEPRLGYWTIPGGVHGKRRDPGGRAPRARRAKKRSSTSRSAACCCSPTSRTPARCTCSSARACARPDFGVTHESLEVKLVDEKDIPWSDLAFPSTEYALRRFVEDRAAGVERHHVAEMQRRFSDRAE